MSEQTPQPVIDYEGQRPMRPSDDGRLRVEGNAIRMPTHGTLPPFCVRCGVPVDDHRKRQKFTWFPGWAYLGLLAGLLPFALIALVLQKKTTVEYSMCLEHRTRLNQRRWIAGGVIALGVILMMVPCLMKPAQTTDQFFAILLLSGVVIVIVGLILMGIMTRALRVRKADSYSAVYQGFGRPFLDIVDAAPQPE